MTFAHLDSAMSEVAELGRRFHDAGHRLYLVGGIVRDQWLDQPLGAESDIDLTTDATPSEIKRIAGPLAKALWGQGERFGTIGLQIGRRSFEITTHRAESYEERSRKPTVAFGDSIEVDLSRRDFTINAMAITIPSGELIDPWGGADDLGDRVLRTPLSADVSFTDDPLRMLRAARFLSRFCLEPVDELEASARSLHERIRIVAIERIGRELEQLLSLDDPGTGLRFLADVGLLAEVLSYGEAGNRQVGPPDVQRALAVCLSVSTGWRARMAGLLAGSFGTVAAVATATERLRLSRADARHIVDDLGAALAVLESNDVGAPRLRRWAAGTEHPDAALDLAAAIATATGKAIEPVRDFAARFAELAATESLALPPTLDGKQIMSLLGIDGGPAVGEALEFLRDRQFDSGPASPETQREWLRQWWSSRAE